MAKRKSVPVTTKITDTAKEIQSKVLKNKSPVMITPIRSLSNVKYQAKTGYFEMLGKNKIRTLTVKTVKTFAQALKMMSLAKELIDTNDMATKREAYYISKNWGKAGFTEQSESDVIMDVALVSIVGEGLHSNQGIAAKCFTAVSNANVNIEMISFGTSTAALYFLVQERSLDRTLRALHSIFFDG